jgi:hypothetical protein
MRKSQKKQKAAEAVNEGCDRCRDVEKTSGFSAMKRDAFRQGKRIACGRCHRTIMSMFGPTIHY